MPSFNVPLEGGGQMVVNASDAQAAADNVRAQGGTPASSGGIINVGGVQPGQGMGPQANNPSTPSSNNNGNTGADQVAASIQKMLNALASGNKQAFDETVREWNLQFGLDQQKFQDDIRRFNENLALSQAGLTGVYQGQQTLAAQQQAANIAAMNAGLTGTFQGQPTLAAQLQNAQLYGTQNPYAGFAQTDPTAKALLAQNPALADPAYQQQLLNSRGYVFYPGESLSTLVAQQQAYSQQMGAVNAAAALQANPFRQAQVIGQAGRILQGMPSASFSAPNTVAGVGTAGGNTQGGMGYLQQLIDDIKSPQANQSTADAFLSQTPTPNKLDSASFLRSTPGTQNLILQAMQEKYGIDPNDALTQIKNTLPQFAAPNTVGTVRRG